MVHADSNLQLFSLHRADFHELLSEYPRSQEAVDNWKQFTEALKQERLEANSNRAHSRVHTTFYDMPFTTRGSRAPGTMISDNDF